MKNELVRDALGVKQHESDELRTVRMKDRFPLS